MALSNSFQTRAKVDPFYSFNRFQKDAAKDWTATPAIGGASGYLENNQDAAFNRRLSQLGFGQSNTSPFANWARQQLANTQLAYKTALAEDPTLLYQDYLQRLGFDQLHNQFSALSPFQRGENRSRYIGPVRTIADI